MTGDKGCIMQMDWNSEVTFTMRDDFIHADMKSDAFETLDDFLDEADEYFEWYLRMNVDLIEDEAIREKVRSTTQSENPDSVDGLRISFSIWRHDGTWVGPKPPVKERQNVLDRIIEAQQRRTFGMTREEHDASRRAWFEREEKRLQSGGVRLLSQLMSTARD